MSGLSNSKININGNENGSENGDLFSGQDIEESNISEPPFNIQTEDLKVRMMNVDIKQINIIPHYACVYEYNANASSSASTNVNINVSNTIKISTKPPQNIDEYESLYNILPENQNYEYEYIGDAEFTNGCNKNFASFGVIEYKSKIDGFEDYEVSNVGPFKYVFPSLTANHIIEVINGALMISKNPVGQLHTITSTGPQSPSVSGGKRRALSDCGSKSSINAMLQLFYDIEDFKTYIVNDYEKLQDIEPENYTGNMDYDNNKKINNLAENLKIIFDYINGNGSDSDSDKQKVCGAIGSIQQLFDFEEKDVLMVDISTKFYKGMNTYFGSKLKNYELFGKSNTRNFPLLLDTKAKDNSIKEYIKRIYDSTDAAYQNDPNLNYIKQVSDNQKYIAIGFFAENKDKIHRMEISKEISVLKYNQTIGSMQKNNDTFELVGYQYLKDDNTHSSYKNIASGQKFEDNTVQGRSTIGSLSNDTKSNFVALYKKKSNTSLLPPPPPQKSSFISNLNPFKGGSDSESDELHKQVQTKFRVSRRKSKKSKK